MSENWTVLRVSSVEMPEVDDFEREVEALRRSQTFQRLLDERSACAKRTALAEIEAEIEQELGEGGKTP